MSVKKSFTILNEEGNGRGIIVYLFFKLQFFDIFTNNSLLAGLAGLAGLA